MSTCKGWYLHNNQLTGEIPPELGHLVNLEGLVLRDNQLTGRLPTELANVEVLCLSGNQLAGEIPPDSDRC